ncbi:MAG: radical SAM protein, partial [Promethearchaeota archaeon]
MNILYILTEEIGNSEIYVPSPIIRISNYLNSRKIELKNEIREEFIDLRLEKLPKFYPKNIDKYKNKLEILLTKLYKSFHFDVVAISCYSSGSYLNTLIVANIIKYKINSRIIIVVGGPHSTLCSEDFLPSNIPMDFSIVKNQTPINYLIPGEAEIPFFELLKDIENQSKKDKKDNEFKFEILKRAIIKDLNSLPEIDFNLINKYKHDYLKGEELYLDFSRGCPYNCYFCINSSHSCRTHIRIKTIDNCIHELNKCLNEGWDRIHISDPIFILNKKSRKEFFKRLNNIPYSKFKSISVSDRIDFVTDQDLKNYKKYDIIPWFGLETISEKLIKRINKTPLKAEDYLNRFEEVLHICNKIELNARFNLILNLPGTDQECLKEIKNYLFETPNSLAQNYFLNLAFRIYYNVPKTFLDL